MNISLREAADVLLGVQKIVLTAHVHPDGDAIGSCLGLMHLLRACGKDAQVLIDDDIPAVFSVLPGYELIGKPTEGEVVSADLLVALDVSLDRVGIVNKVCTAPTLNIDHHVTNDGKADKLYLDGDAAATAEIIYELAPLLGQEFSKDAAMCLYTGMATDTGWFRFSNTTPKTMRAAAEMIAAGVEPNVISEALEVKPYDHVKNLADAMERIEVWHEGRAAGVFLDAKTMELIEHTDGLIDQIRVIAGTEIAVVMKEKEEGKSRVSLRSHGVDVTKIATQFGGGGHIRAAGCTIEKPFREARAALIKAIDAAIDEVFPTKKKTGAEHLQTGGFLNLLKPPGMSSHDVVSFVRHTLHVKRVGHAGTLDPAAAGVLPVAVGQSARLLEYLETTNKTYRAEVKFGYATDSGDDTGEIIAEKKDFVFPSKEAIEEALKHFTGRITQVPPAHSAIKINGRKAYELQREGKKVDVPSREVTIYRIELLEYRPEDKTILIDVDCSKGTYIRSLCMDIGQYFDIPATMSFLVRRQVGDFALENALTLEELAQKGENALLDASDYLSHIERFELSPSREKAFRNGLSTTLRYRVPQTDTLRVYVTGRLVGIGRFDRKTQELIPVKVMPEENI